MSYPSVLRRVRPPLMYGGAPPVGASLPLGGGQLTQVSGLPTLLPVTPLPGPLRRP